MAFNRMKICVLSANLCCFQALLFVTLATIERDWNTKLYRHWKFTSFIGKF